jgi:hypothetical protein
MAESDRGRWFWSHWNANMIFVVDPTTLNYNFLLIVYSETIKTTQSLVTCCNPGRSLMLTPLALLAPKVIARCETITGYADQLYGPKKNTSLKPLGPKLVWGCLCRGPKIAHYAYRGICWILWRLTYTLQTPNFDCLTRLLILATSLYQFNLPNLARGQNIRYVSNASWSSICNRSWKESAAYKTFRFYYFTQWKNTHICLLPKTRLPKRTTWRWAGHTRRQIMTTTIVPMVLHGRRLHHGTCI